MSMTCRNSVEVGRSTSITREPGISAQTWPTRVSNKSSWVRNLTATTELMTSGPGRVAFMATSQVANVMFHRKYSTNLLVCYRLNRLAMGTGGSGSNNITSKLTTTPSTMVDSEISCHRATHMKVSPIISGHWEVRVRRSSIADGLLFSRLVRCWGSLVILASLGVLARSRTVGAGNTPVC